MQIEAKDASMGLIDSLCGEYQKQNHIDLACYEKYDVKRGLRNADGTGVMAGVTQIGNVQGYYIQDGERQPAPGRLIYRGIDVADLIGGFTGEGRFGFEETAYLLLMGALPSREQLDAFCQLLSGCHTLPHMFTEDMILKAPSPDVMNKLARSVLALYSYDSTPDDMALSNQLRQAVELIARVPVIVAHAFAVKRHYYDEESLYLHRPQPGLSVAENFLYSVRHDNQYTPEEAHLLDLCLVLHAEHGGGNNSAFTCRVLSSSGTDIYSSIAAAVGSLKGPRHGGANKKGMEALNEKHGGGFYLFFRPPALNPRDGRYMGHERKRGALTELARLLRRETGDRSGLIYGIGHAIYTLSDPRAVILKRFAKKLAAGKGMLEEFELFEAVERLAPEVLHDVKGEDKVVCANVDFYSGLVYKMMGIPQELYTPLFAVARMVGWCAHRIEEVYQPGNRIIRPAYKAVAPMKAFVPLDQR